MSRELASGFEERPCLLPEVSLGRVVLDPL